MPEDYTGKLSVRRVNVDRQGYSPGGRYFGIGPPVYEVLSMIDNSVWFYIRASDRTGALREVRSMYPVALGIGTGRKTAHTKKSRGYYAR
jgi:hypothetical protein